MAPLHPATVHFPIAFLLGASGLDLITHLAQSSPKTILPLSKILSTSVRSLIQHTTHFSYFLTIAGLVTAVPAILSGGAQALQLISKRGYGAKSSKLTLLHAATMDITIFAAAYNWWTRSTKEGFMSEQSNFVVSGAVLGIMGLSAHLGGKLVYEHGIGVERNGVPKKVEGKKDL